MAKTNWVSYVLAHTRVDEETGIVWWTKRERGRNIKKPVGCLDSNGYIKCQVGGVPTYAHIIVWIHKTGEYPSQIIDHKNQKRDDNRPANLRLSNPSKNMLNRPVASSNACKVRGVYKTPSGRYKVQIAGVYLGTYDTVEKAKERAHGKSI